MWRVRPWSCGGDSRCVWLRPRYVFADVIRLVCTLPARFDERLRAFSSFFFSCLLACVTESPVSVGVQVLPQGYWYTVLYSSIILVLCLVVCLVGAHIYSRTAFAILLLITVSLLSIFISSVVVKRKDFVITRQLSGNQTVRYNTSYTGFNATTLRNNLGRECQGHGLNLTWTLSLMIPLLVFFSFLQLVTLWITAPTLSCLLPPCLQSCLPAALGSWLEPTCQVVMTAYARAHQDYSVRYMSGQCACFCR